MIISLIVIAVCRGRGKTSIVGITRCSFGDWFLLFVLIIIAVVITLITIKMLISEHAEKV